MLQDASIENVCGLDDEWEGALRLVDAVEVVVRLTPIVT